MTEQTGKEFAEKLQNNIRKVLVGKEQVTELLLTALLADGHVLLEDVPGTGKVPDRTVLPGAVYPGSAAR